MDDYLDFSGPVKLIIVEKALVTKVNGKFHEKGRSGITRMILDSKGKTVSEIRELETLEYQYNEEENLTLIRKKDKKGTLLEETTQIWQNGLLLKKERISADGAVRERCSYRYDELNRKVSESSQSRHIRFEYNGKHVSREYRFYGREPELVLVFERDSDGHPLEAVTHSREGAVLRREEYEWEDNRLKKWRIWGREGLFLKDDNFEYSCFHDGNWLKRTRFSLLDRESEEPVEVLYRSIAYSDSCPEINPLYKVEKEVLKENSRSLTFRDGSIYRGEIHMGKMEGRGYIQWPDGSSYKGEFHNNRMEGQGILTWPNGDIYSGTFNSGYMEGIGRLRWSDGKTFYGIFENNRRTNQGIIEE